MDFTAGIRLAAGSACVSVRVSLGCCSGLAQAGTAWLERGTFREAFFRAFQFRAFQSESPYRVGRATTSRRCGFAITSKPWFVSWDEGFLDERSAGVSFAGSHLLGDVRWATFYGASSDAGASHAARVTIRGAESGGGAMARFRDGSDGQCRVREGQSQGRASRGSDQVNRDQVSRANQGRDTSCALMTARR